MSYLRKALLFVIALAMVLAGLMTLTYGLSATGGRTGLFIAGGAAVMGLGGICSGRISLRRYSPVSHDRRVD